MSARHHDSNLWRTQNFLRRRAIEPLLARCELRSSDVVYDLGAGTGVLTGLLARTAGRVVAIEKDEALCVRLRMKFHDWSNVSIRCADLLEHGLPRRPYKVFASPPFDITAALVAKLTNAAVPPDDAFLALQREAAERYCGRPHQTVVSLLLVPYFEASIVHVFSRDDFVPQPGVEVVMLRLRKRGPPLVRPQHRQLYRDFVVNCFTSGRGTIDGALARSLGTRVARRLLAEAGLAHDLKPSHLPYAAWLGLFELFSRLPSALHQRIAGAENRLIRRQRRLHKRHRTRTPRDDLIGSLRRKSHDAADAFDKSFALEPIRHRARAGVIDRALERAHRHRATDR